MSDQVLATLIAHRKTKGWAFSGLTLEWFQDQRQNILNEIQTDRTAVLIKYSNYCINGSAAVLAINMGS